MRLIGYFFLVLLCFVVLSNISKHGFRSYLINLLIGLDQVGNAILGGTPRETISSRCTRGQNKWYWKWLAYILNWIAPGHIKPI
jgi:hypothetical protein